MYTGPEAGGIAHLQSQGEGEAANPHRPVPQGCEPPFEVDSFRVTLTGIMLNVENIGGPVPVPLSRCRCPWLHRSVNASKQSRGRPKSEFDFHNSMQDSLL